MSIEKKKKPKIVVVCGPTGSGKTGLAVLLCKKFNGEIINADSRQVYREMDIGTSKDVKTQMSNVKCQKLGAVLPQYYIKDIPIHLINIIDPNEKYSVGQFKKDAEGVIADIVSRGKVPFVVGGTGLYIDALVENFQFPISKNNPETVEARLSRSDLGGETPPLQDLIALLGKLDPEALDIVDLKNRRRVERAVEVCLSTGIPFTKQRIKSDPRYDVLKLAPAVSLEREKLYEKINKRVEKMIEEGLEKEVRGLVEKYGWESEAMTGIGYREWHTFYENYKLQITNYKQNPNVKIQMSKDRDLVIDQIKQDTRNYAKRQMTWFKRSARNTTHSVAGGDKEIQFVCPIKSGKAGAKQFDWVNLKEAEKLVEKFLGK